MKGALWWAEKRAASKGVPDLARPCQWLEPPSALLLLFAPSAENSVIHFPLSTSFNVPLHCYGAVQAGWCGVFRESEGRVSQNCLQSPGQGPGLNSWAPLKDRLQRHMAPAAGRGDSGKFQTQLLLHRSHSILPALNRSPCPLLC